ncbi:MAG: transferrin-binding protein-like solute binding protein [Rhodobacter sp.]|nr:transferrin-binding protein-like solute binding protein [Rhodobacter sp.]
MTATLSACGGGDTGTEEVRPASGAHPPLGEGETLASRIGDARSPADATVFRTNTVAGLLASENETTEALSPERKMEVRMFRAASGDEWPTVAITWEGDTVTFEPEHTRDLEFDVEYQINCSNDPAPSQCAETQKGWANYVLWGWGGDFEDYADGTADHEYHIPFNAIFPRPAEDMGRNTYLSAVIGSETAANALPSATAEYRGGAGVRFFPPGGWEGHELFLSNLTLTAEFAENTVSGVMDNWRLWPEEGEEYSGLVYTVNSAPITGNGFTATITPAADCEGCWPLESSALSGTFYGPSAEEAGGTIRGVIGKEGGDRAGWVGSGVFFSAAE